MASYKVLIIDDEPISRRITKNFLSQVEGYEVVEEASDAKIGFGEVMKNNIDLIFLDIEMPEISGLDFLRSLANPPKVIIISAHRNYAIEGFELNVVDYLLKPVSIERFKTALQKFEAFTPQTKEIQRLKEEYLFIRSDRKHYKIDFKFVTFIESQADYLTVHTKDGNSLKTKETIGSMEERLPSQFIRIHRSYILTTPPDKSRGILSLRTS